MGIVYIETLANMPIELLNEVMGENGKIIWEKANGIDTRPVQPYSEQKSIGSERTFETDTTDIKFLHQKLSKMVQDVCFDMRKQNRLCAGLIKLL